jgi:predicted dinucleotide-binding enzyme
MTIKTIGILGAGKVGIVLAQLALKAGYQVLIAGSGRVEKIALTIEILAPGAKALTAAEVGQQADVVILALPLSKYQTLQPDTLVDKLVIDATNYWWEVDGKRADLTNPLQASSELIQQFLPNSRVVKAFNHMGYHDLYDESAPAGSPQRKALAVAGDNWADVEQTQAIVEALGFDSVPVGNLADSIQLEPGSDVFGANVTQSELKKLLAQFANSQRGQEIQRARKAAGRPLLPENW